MGHQKDAKTRTTEEVPYHGNGTKQTDSTKRGRGLYLKISGPLVDYDDDPPSKVVLHTLLVRVWSTDQEDCLLANLRSILT